MIEQQFATMPVPKLFFKLAIPSVLSMVFSSIYVIADGIFVGRFLGEQPFAAVNLIMPFLMIIFAVSNMIAVGSSVKVSTALGEGDIPRARRLFSASVLMIIGVGALFALVGTFSAKAIIFAVIKDKTLATLAYEYVGVFILSLPAIMPLFAMDNFLRACGKAKYSMFVNISVSIFNIVLDYVFLGYLKLGIAYSALASVISMVIGACFSFAPFFTNKLTLKFTKPKITRRELGGILFNGSADFFRTASNSCIAMLVNIMLFRLGGSVAVASYGIVMSIDTLLMCVMYGVLDAVQPVVSYNLGARKIKRSFSFFNITSLVAGTISIVCMVVILVIPRSLAGVFMNAGSVDIIDMTVAALYLFAPSYVFNWFNMASSAFLTALDRPKESLVIMLFNAIIFPLISIFALTSFMGVYGIFFMTSVSALLTFVISLTMWLLAKKKLKHEIALSEDD